MNNNHLVTTYSDESIEYVVRLFPSEEKNYIIVLIGFLRNESDEIIYC